MAEWRARIDHVVIGVADQLDAAAARYRQLGFALLERGHHSLGSSNHLAVFGQDYLELLGYEPGRAPQQALDPRWQQPRGLLGLVLRPPPVQDLAAWLAEHGLPGQEPRQFARPVILPDGRQVEARFRTLHLPAEILPHGMVFFCHHETPEHVWQASWQRHENGASGLHELVIEARDPVLSTRPLHPLFGERAFQAVDGGLALRAANASVLWLSAAAVEARFAGLAERSPDGRDRAVGLTLRCASLAGTQQRLLQAGVPGLHQQSRRLLVPARQAFGVALAFVEA